MQESFRRLEDSVTRGFENVQFQLSKLPGEYVARREFDRYRDEQTIDMQAALAQHDRDIKSVKDEMRDLKIDAKERETKAEQHVREARTVRITVIGLVVATAIALPSALWALAQLLH